MRLIDADALIDQAINGVFPKLYIQLCFCPKDIDNAPTIDPVKHGHWEDENPIEPNPMFRAAVCSVCGCTEGNPNNYCPSCGARMDGTHDN